MEDEEDITDKAIPASSSSDNDQAARLLQVTIVGGGAEEQPSNAVANESGTVLFASATNRPEEYVLQSPDSISRAKSLEQQIERELEELTEVERKQVEFDMGIPITATKGDDFAAAEISSSTSSSVSTKSRVTVPPSTDTASLVSEIESLGEELLRLLEDPNARDTNPLYPHIAKALRSSDSAEDLYANSVAFRTKLLRAEHYDVQKAARRTAAYLTLLWESFGEELLGRPILLSDLTPSERQLQRKGHQQIFRFRDQAKSKEEHDSTKLDRYTREINPQAGRRIAGSFDLCRCTSTDEPAIDNEKSKLRVLLYLMQVASDDEETQKQGIIFIFMLALRTVLGKMDTGLTIQTSMRAEAKTTKAVSTTSDKATTSIPRNESESLFAGDCASLSEDQPSEEEELLHFSPHEKSHRHNHTLTRVRILSKIFRCGPVRVASIHVCSPNRSELNEIKYDLLHAFHPLERVRTRFHNGTSMECSLSLNKVGIPTDRLPIKYDGTIKTEDHLQWIAIQEAKESAAKQNKAFDIVECPLNMDILSGRGQLVRSHPGNVSFRKDFIRARSARYDMAPNREQKNAIADDILDDISILRRRFLKQHQGAGYWNELDPKTAKEKVMMAFREFRKSQRSQTQQKQKKISQATAIQPSLPRSSSSSSVPLSQQPPGNSAPLPMSQSRAPAPDHEQQYHPTNSHHHSQQQQQHQPDYNYPPYPPVSSEIDGSGMTHSGSSSNMFHLHAAAAAAAAQAPPYYPPIPPPHLHNPYGYASSLPLPPPHIPPPHLHHPLAHHHPHSQQHLSNQNEEGSATPGIPQAPVAYHHHGMLSAISTELESPQPAPQHRGNNSEREDPNHSMDERTYKRYRTM